MVGRRSVLFFLAGASLLLAPVQACSTAAPPPPGGSAPLPEGHPSMRELILDGKHVCLLERDGQRYLMDGRCTAAPPLEQPPEGNGGGLPPGHPPVGPGEDFSVPPTESASI